MSKVNPRLVYWIKAVTHHKGVPGEDGKLIPFTDGHRLILISLAADCLDFGTGAGYCSARTLAERSGKARSTVMRALELGRKAGLIEQTRRGHRITNETKIASEWRIIYPEPTSGSVDVGSYLDPMSTYADIGSEPTSESADPTSESGRPNVRIRATQRPATRTPSGNEASSGNEGSSGDEASSSSRAAARDSDDEIFARVTTANGSVKCPDCRREIKRVGDEHTWECRHFGTAPSLDGDGVRVYWPVTRSRAGPRPCTTAGCHGLVAITRQGSFCDVVAGKPGGLHACPF